MSNTKAIQEAQLRYLKRLELYKAGATENINETPAQQQARIARAKKDVAFFVEYYLPEYATAKSADFQIELAKRVRRDKTAKIIVRWGRGLAKSVWADLIIPLWLYINNDIQYMVIIGNNSDKAKILLADLQSELEANARFIHDFGEQQMHGIWEDGYFATKNGFTAKALGMGQSPRGLRNKAQRPDYIVADDLEDKDTVKNPKRQDEMVQWIERDLLATMDGNTRRYLHCNNNFAPRTIQERLRLRHQTDWHTSHVNAYNDDYKPAWSAKYSDDYYRDIEDELGRLAAQSEFNNRPHIEGKIFTKEQIQFLSPKLFPKWKDFKTIVAHWDIAYSGKNDFNAVRIWGLKDNNFYYIDSLVRQCKMWEALEFIAATMLSLPETVAIHWHYEAAFWNDAVTSTISEFEKANKIRLPLTKVECPKTKKYERILRLQPYYQRKRIFYPEAKEMDSDLIEGNQQLFGIEPNYNTHDDAPDADEQAIGFLEKHIKKEHQTLRFGKFTKNQHRCW